MSKTVNVPLVLFALLCAFALIGLIAYARGPEHHRGDEIGSHGTKVIVVRPAQ
jgi:hypothetical protein